MVAMKNKKTAVEVYLSAVFKWGLIILVCASMCATVMFNAEKLFGLYPTVPWLATIMLGVMDVTFCVIAVIIIKSSFDKEGYLKEGRLKIGKIFSAIVVVVQWNYLLYMVPTRTFWGFLFFFLILILVVIPFFMRMKLLFKILSVMIFIIVFVHKILSIYIEFIAICKYNKKTADQGQ